MVVTITADAFAYVSDLVRRESAIVLEPGKEYLVESRLLPLARAAGLEDVSAFVHHVRSRPPGQQHVALVEALTTNETSWFRDKEPFDVLAHTVFPAVRERNAVTRTVRIWSAACSSGQEAYSIAMLAAEHLLPFGYRVEIVATDLSQGMLDRVSAGRYSQLEVGRGLPAPLLVRHFRRDGTGWQVADELRSMVTVRRLNLAAPFGLMPVFDIVFLRNVLIYFDLTTKREILARVRQVTGPGGYLFLGAAETTIGIDEEWERTSLGRCTLNRRPGASLAPSLMELARNG